MIGRKLAHYTVLEHLGAGGMGEVYRARDESLGREVALKVLPEELERDPKRIARFHREAHLASQLSHTNIATIYEAGEAGGRHFITMELVKGETLASRVKPGGLPLDRILEIALPLAEGLAEAHEAGVIHRDLKPANVMLDEKGRVKILDFGLSRTAEETELTADGLTSTGQVMGTPQYMSPEQVRGEEVDARSDLFSLGAILYELATGAQPFEGDSLAVVMTRVVSHTPTPILSVNPHAGELFAHVVDRLLEKDPDHRVQHASDLAEELRSLKSPSTAALPPPVRRRSPAFAVASLLAAALVVWGVFALRPGDGADGVVPPALPGSGRYVLAIVPFSIPEGDAEAETVARGLTYGLFEMLGVPDVDLITTTWLRGRARHLGMDADSLDAVAASELASAEGAQGILLCELERGPSGLDLHMELLDTGTGRYRTSENITGVASSGVPDTVGRLASTILDELGVAPPRTGEDVTALSESPEALELWASGLAAYERTEWEEAIRFLEASVRLDPGFHLARTHLTRALWWTERFEEARAALEPVLQDKESLSAIDREKVEILSAFVRGRVSPELGVEFDTPGLTARARELARAHPRDQDALELWMECATHHTTEKNIEEALRVSQLLLELAPDSGPAAVHLLDNAAVDGRPDLIQELLAGAGDELHVSAWAPVGLLALGRHEEALRLVRDRERELFYDHRLRAIEAALALEEYTLALEIQALGWGGDPGAFDRWHRHITALIALGRFEEARIWVGGGVGYAVQRLDLGIVPPVPRDRASRACRVARLARLGEIAPAVEELERMLQTPGDGGAGLVAWAQGEIELARGSTALARSLFVEAADTATRNGTYSRGFLRQRAGRALVEAGEYEEAERLLLLLHDDAARFDCAVWPNWNVVPRIRSMYDLAVCREAQGDLEGALAWLERFLATWHEPDAEFPEIEEGLLMYEGLSGGPYVPGGD